MIHATFDTPLVLGSEHGTASRTITGMAVPWGVPGRVSDGSTVIFHRGSLDAAARPLALRDHDPTRPIGRVTAAEETPVGMSATMTVSRVNEGNDALILAGDGVLGAFSVGAEPVDYEHDQDGTMHVHAAIWRELSLLTFGAYPQAVVTTVTASPPGGSMPTMTDAPDEPEAPEAPEPELPEEPAEPVETSATVVPIAAAGRLPARPSERRHPYAHVGIREFASVVASWRGSHSPADRILASMQSSPGAFTPDPQFIAAALTDITLVGTNNVGLVYRPAYQAELVELISRGSPAVDSIRQGDLERGDYPNKTFLRWGQTPVPALQTAEKTEIASGPASVASTNVPVQTWAVGNDISQQVLDFGSPGFVEEYIRVAGVNYAKTIDTYAVTALMAAATAVTTVAADNLVQVITKLFAALDWTKVPDGALFMLVSPDLATAGMGLTGATNQPVFWDGNINFGSAVPTTTMGGLTIQVDTNMPARSALLGPRSGATWYDVPGTPFSLRAVEVARLGLNVAVYGYGALGVQYPGSFVKTTVPSS